MKRWANLSVIFIFLVALGLGSLWIDSQIDENGDPPINTALLKKRGKQREPAAIREIFDFSSLEGSALKKASAQRLLAGLSFQNDAHGMQVQLGHFVLKDQTGARDFACHLFDRVELRFQGEGMATHGHKPSLVVQAPCRYGKDINHISGIQVPFQRLMQEPAADFEVSFGDYPEHEFRTYEVVDYWPETWQLIGLRLFNKDEQEEEVRVSQATIREWYQGPMLIQSRETSSN